MSSIFVVGSHSMSPFLQGIKVFIGIIFILRRVHLNLGSFRESTGAKAKERKMKENKKSEGKKNTKIVLNLVVFHRKSNEK